MSTRALSPAAAFLALALAPALLAAGCGDDKKTTVVSRSTIATRLAQPDLTGGDVVLSYRLVGDPGSSADVSVEFSADGGRTYALAAEDTARPGTQGTRGLSAGPFPGEPHTFAWAGFPRGVPVTVIVTPIAGGRLGVPDEASFTTPVKADRFEPANDASATAPFLPAGPTADLSIGPDGDDIDVFKFTTGAAPALLSVQMDFAGTVSDLDLFISNAAGEILDSAATERSTELSRIFSPGVATYDLQIASFDEVPIPYVLNITQTAVTVDFQETFDAFGSIAELTSASWTTVPTSQSVWEVGTPTSGPGVAASGSTVVATILGGTYPSDADVRLITPSFNVTTGKVFVTFLAYVDTEEPVDEAIVEAEVGASGVFVPLGTLTGDLTLGSGYRSFVLAGPPGLAPGAALRIAFRFRSDDSVELPGVYIDDLRVVSAP